MKILIFGAGKMGSFFVDLLSFDHETAVYDIDPRRLRFMYNTLRFTSLNEIDDFAPELVINAVTLKYTLQVFETVHSAFAQGVHHQRHSLGENGLKGVLRSKRYALRFNPPHV